MALDERYFTSIDLQEYLVNKDTGAPLANGKIKLYQDTSRTTPKNAFTLSGTPPAYTYEALPNPIVLSSVGTAQDNDGNDIAIYFYPYDAAGNLQLYYVVITDENDIVQLTRQAWPNITAADDPTTDSPETVANQISNSQFVDVLFDTTLGLSLVIAGAGTNTYAIAPDWDLIVTTTGASTVGITRTAVQGSSNIPGNPPYLLRFNAGANISLLQLRQRLTNNPGIFSPSVNGVGGFLSASILLANGTSAQVIYAPSVGALGNTQIILNENNTSGAYVQYDNTIQLIASANTATSDTGYVDILIKLPIAGISQISNVQIASLNSNQAGIKYEQDTVNRQKDYLFHYYNPLLSYKPIPSYLCGWDFPLNPTQFLGPTIAAQAVGANKSFYAWDQTIIFQSANSGISISRATSGAIRLTAAATTQMAIIQYLPQAVAREVLNDAIAVHIRALTSNDVTATVTLWYSTDANLPSTIISNNSIVLTLDANGKPATFNGAWSEVPRGNLGSAQFTIQTSANTNFNDYAFTGWDMQGIAACSTATWFAIVVGTASVTSTRTIDFASIGLCSGNIATRPAPKSIAETRLDCQSYYCSSFNPGVVPASALGGTAGISITEEILTPSSGAGITTQVRYPVKMYAAPTTITTFNPINAGVQMYDFSNGGDCSATSVAGTIGPNQLNSQFGFLATATGPTPSSGAIIGFGWTADARLGQ